LSKTIKKAIQDFNEKTKQQGDNMTTPADQGIKASKQDANGTRDLYREWLEDRIANGDTTAKVALAEYDRELEEGL